MGDSKECTGLVTQISADLHAARCKRRQPAHSTESPNTSALGRINMISMLILLKNCFSGSPSLVPWIREVWLARVVVRIECR